MTVYFLDNEQKVIKAVPNTGATLIVQTQELPDDNSLLKDMLHVQLKNDERLFDAQYMAIKSYKGNRNSFDMYRIASEIVPDATTEFDGVQIGPYELEGVVVEDLRPQNQAVSYVVNRILQDSDWRLGYIDDNLPKVTTNFYYMSAKDSLKKLQEVANVELTFKVEISGNKITDKWVEVYKQLGNRTLKRFNYGTNLLTIKRETNSTELYTALIGRGKGKEIGETDAGNATYGRKISFKDIVWSKANGDPVDKPKGQNYIELPEATSEYGVKQIDGSKKPRKGSVEYNETEDPEVLIRQTWESLQFYARPKVLFSATVANIGDSGIGDTVTVHRHKLNMHYKTRVRKVVRNRKNNNHTQVEIGDVVHTPSTKRQSNINSKLDNLESSLGDVQAEVSYVVKSADGKNDITHGNVEPERKRVGDSWVRDHPSLSGETQWLVWNGEVWELLIDTSDTTKNARDIEDALADLDAVRETANKVETEVSNAVANAGFTTVDEVFTNLDTISNRADVNAQTAISNAYDAMASAQSALSGVSGLQSDVSRIDVDIDDLEGSLSLKAKNTRVDAISNTVNQHNLDIQANARELAVKADSSTVDTINNQVSTLESEFNFMSGEISSKVSRAELSGVIDGLEYENRNLLLNSKEINHGIGINTMPLNNKHLEDGAYTISFDYEINPNGGTPSSFLIMGESVIVRVPLKSSEESRAKATFNLKSENVGKDLVIYAGYGYSESISNGVLFKELKLEKGKKATDHTPAPEDIDAQFDYIQTEWTQTFESFQQDVTAIDGRVTSQRQDIDGITDTVSGHDGRLTTVERTASGLQSTVADKAEKSEVTQLAGALRSEISDIEIGGRNYVNERGNGQYRNPLSDLYLHDSEFVKGTKAGDWITISYLADFWNMSPDRVNSFEVSLRVKYSDGERQSLRASFQVPSGQTSYLGRVNKSFRLKRAIVALPPYANYITIDTDGQGKIEEVQVEKGNKATTYEEAPEVNKTAISQNTKNINFRVEKGDVLSQINIEADNTLIETGKLYLDASSVIFSGSAFIPGAVIQDASIDSAQIADLAVTSAKIANLDVSKISGNIAEFVRIGLNNGLDNTQIDGSGIHMLGSGTWRRTYLTATGFDLYNGQGGSGKAGAIGYFKPHVNEATDEENYMRATEGARHYVGIGVNSSHNFAIGYNQYTTNLNGFNRAVEINGESGSSTFFRTLYMANGIRMAYNGGSYIGESANSTHFDINAKGRIRFYNSIDSLKASFGANFDIYTDIDMHGNNIYGQSDRRLKKGIRKTKLDSLESIMKLRLVDYEWIGEDKPEGTQFGLIAQDSPDLLHYSVETGYYNINTSRQIMMTTHGLQQLAFKHEKTSELAGQAYFLAETLADKMNRLENRIEELERKVA